MAYDAEQLGNSSSREGCDLFIPRAAAHAFAASLQSAPLRGTTNVDGPVPALSDLLDEERYGLHVHTRAPLHG